MSHPCLSLLLINCACSLQFQVEVQRQTAVRQTDPGLRAGVRVRGCYRARVTVRRHVLLRCAPLLSPLIISHTYLSILQTVIDGVSLLTGVQNLRSLSSMMTTLRLETWPTPLHLRLSLIRLGRKVHRLRLSGQRRRNRQHRKHMTSPSRTFTSMRLCGCSPAPCVHWLCMIALHVWRSWISCHKSTRGRVL